VAMIWLDVEFTPNIARVPDIVIKANGVMNDIVPSNASDALTFLPPISVRMYVKIAIIKALVNIFSAHL